MYYSAIGLLAIFVLLIVNWDILRELPIKDKPAWKVYRRFLGTILFYCCTDVLWGLMEAVTVVFARFCSPVYPAIGKPRVSVIVQILHVVVLIPAIIISGQYGFETLYVTRCLIRLELVLVNMIAVYMMIKQSPWKMIVNILPEATSALVMAAVGYLLLWVNHGIALSIVWVAVCVVVYFATLYYLFPADRNMVSNLKQTALKTIKRK